MSLMPHRRQQKGRQAQRSRTINKFRRGHNRGSLTELARGVPDRRGLTWPGSRGGGSPVDERDLISEFSRLLDLDRPTVGPASRRGRDVNLAVRVPGVGSMGCRGGVQGGFQLGATRRRRHGSNLSLQIPRGLQFDLDMPLFMLGDRQSLRTSYCVVDRSTLRMTGSNNV